MSFCGRAYVFSIIIPVYNVEGWLVQCLDSVLSQDFTDYEIIVIDDCSPDESYKIYETYAKKHDCIRIIKHEVNKGLGGARNTGIQAAKGEWIFFLDSDDLMAQGALSYVVRIHEQDDKEVGQVDIVLGARDFFSSQKTWTPHYIKKLYHEQRQAQLNNFPEILQDIYTCNKIWRKKFLVENDIKFRENIFYEDIDFFIFSMAKARYFIVGNQCLVKVRRYRAGSITTVLQADKFYALLQGYEHTLTKLEKHHLLSDEVRWVILNRLLLCFIKPLVAIGFYLSISEKQQSRKFHAFLKSKAHYYKKEYTLLKKTQSHHKTAFNKGLQVMFFILYSLPRSLFHITSLAYVSLFKAILRLTKKQTMNE